MYTQFHRLQTKPFDLRPDPDVVFMSDVHKEGLAVLRYGVIDRKSFLLLTGEVGVGKTTLLQKLASSLDTKFHTCLLANPTLSVRDFYFYLAESYGLGDIDSNKAQFIISLSRFLKECAVKDERVLLIIDEAQALPADLFEEIRLLSNQQFSEHGVMSIFLVGQPELNARLGGERLLPLRQRIGIRFHLNPFNLEETKEYIRFRLRMAGAQRLDIFSPEAIELIQKEAKGIPRLINIICDQALLTAYSEGRREIDTAVIRDTIQELHIPGEETPLPLPVEPRKNFFKKITAGIFRL
jgi:general secretion pathway protein A